MVELATMVIDLTDSHSRIVHRSRPEDDPRQRRPDISGAQDLLDWKPRTMLKDGLVRPSRTLMSCSPTRNYGRSSLRSHRLEQRCTSVSNRALDSPSVV
jgi:hypothetical protein